MPFAVPSGEDTGAYEQPISQSGVIQVTQPILPVPLPATLAPSGSWVSGPILADGFKVIGAAVVMTQIGTITIQLWLDVAGTIPQGSLVSTAVTANTAAVVNAGNIGGSTANNMPFASYTISINNTSVSTATLTNVVFCINST